MKASVVNASVVKSSRKSLSSEKLCGEVSLSSKKLCGEIGTGFLQKVYAVLFLLALLSDRRQVGGPVPILDKGNWGNIESRQRG